MDEQNSSPTPLVSPTAPVSPAKNSGKPSIDFKNIYIAVGLMAVAIIGVLLYPTEKGTFSIKTQYSQVYTLVNDKVSISAPIQINLPKGVSKEGAEQQIAFDPDLAGEWVATEQPQVIAFKPAKKLEVGKYYTVALAAAEGEIVKDFQADEDPVIVDIFPKAGSEADESSAITVVFNRPMVPLTTLSELENDDVPVTITPATEGKFKWISTRSLQFIPKNTLIRSAHYEVSVNPGFVSMDGLSVSGKKHTFTTRPLRFENSTNGTIRYNQPLKFRFNQPVDLDKTVEEISLKNLTTGSSIPFRAEYGSRLVYDPATRENIKLEDRSVISILPQSDRHGRAHFWDFENSYRASLSRAYPVGGDILYTNPIQSSVITTGIIQSVTVQSDRTDLASAELFDPQGKVTVTFYEDIDLKKSDIEVKGLKTVEYGQKCKPDGSSRDSSYNKTCEKIDDQTTLIFSFDANKFSVPGEAVSLYLKRVVNTQGIRLDTDGEIIGFKVYPQLKIYTSTPQAGATTGSITKLVLCTNSPLKALSGESFYSAVKANNYIVLGRWYPAYLQQYNEYDSKPLCAIGQYVNVIQYGLHPQKAYTLSLALADVFGQTIEQKLVFSTEKAPKLYLQFHALDKQYNVTTPDKTKLTYAVENFDSVNVHICKVDPLGLIRYINDRPSSRTSGESLWCAQSVSATVAIPPDLWVNHYFQINVADYFSDPKGHYVLTFSNPQYTNWSGEQQYERTYLSVTNLAVVEKLVSWDRYDTLPQLTKSTVDAAPPQGSLYWISRIGTLAPEIGATISVVSKMGTGNSQIGIASKGKTNISGIATFPLIKDVVGATVESGSDSAIVSTWTDTVNGSWRANSASKVYLYTDRPIYRPGQEVFLKGIYRLDYDGEYKIDTDISFAVEIFNSKGELVHSKNATLSKYGTFNASFKLPSDAPLGGYYISVLNQYSYFNVQEYVGAAFEAAAKTQKDEYIAGENALIDVSGKYYFGVPVDGGRVEYSFTAQNYYFDRYTDEYFNFGSGWYGCYDCGYGDSYIKSGQAILGENGQAQISQALDFNTLFGEDSRDSSKIVVFHATIIDGQGKSVSTQKSFIVHRGDFYLGVKTDPSFVGINQPFSLRLKTVDTQGKSVRQGGIDVVINKVEWKSFKRQEVDGNYYNRTERVLTPVITKKLSTDGKGDFSDEFKLAEPGEYELQAVASDSRGNTIKAHSYLYVYGQGNVSVRATNNATLDITAERSDLSVGDRAKIIFQSPYQRAKALITLERGRIFDYTLVDVNQNIYEHEFPIESRFTPNLYASVLLLSPDPEIKFGQVPLSVDRKEKELTITVLTDKTSYLPGEKVNLTVTTSDVSGKRVSAEVSVAVADLSVLALQGNPKKDPLVFFYGGFPLAVTTISNIKNILTEAEIPTGTKGGGGGNADDLAKKKRGEFKDTAFWSAQVETNANGEAHVSFTLPDNLTRWQIESLGVTEDTKVGVRYQEITAQKKIMLVPLRPRFVIPGDEFEIGAQVFNQTDRTQTLSLSYESATLGLVGGGKRDSKTLKAGESAVVYWSVKAPESQTSGTHTIVLSAKNSEFEDTVENVIPVNQNVTYESVATANSTADKSAKEYVFIPEGVQIDQGGLTVKTSATLAVFLSDALKYLFQYPYGGAEQLASKLSSIAIVKRSLGIQNVGDKFNLPLVTFDGNTYTVDEVVSKGLSKIYDAQRADGGFSYYRSLPSDLYLTINMVNALADLQSAGYAINRQVVQSATNYIGATLLAKGVKQYGVDLFISATYVISRVGGSSYYNPLVEIILSSATPVYIKERASSLTLAQLALIAQREDRYAALLERVVSTLENRVEIDSRGAYVESNSSNIVWQYYETPIKNTALFLKVLSQQRRNYSQTDKLIRWLLSSRSPDGAWGSTQNTISVIDAFTEYLSWKRETESDFALTLSLDEVKLETFDFNKKTVFSMFEKFLPIASFETNTMHTLLFGKENRNKLANTFYYDIGLKYYLPAEQIAPRDEGITIERSFYSMKDSREETPLIEAKVGEVLKGKLTVITAKPRNLFAIEDFIPAGFELVNFNLSTEGEVFNEQPFGNSKGMGPTGEEEVFISESTKSPSFFDYLRHPVKSLAALSTVAKSVDLYNDRFIYQNELHPDFEELRDDRLFLFKQNLAAGHYTYEYYLRATTPGTFRHLPAVASELYFPENFGRTGGSLFRVNK